MSMLGITFMPVPKTFSKVKQFIFEYFMVFLQRTLIMTLEISLLTASAIYDSSIRIAFFWLVHLFNLIELYTDFCMSSGYLSPLILQLKVFSPCLILMILFKAISFDMLKLTQL